MIKNHLLAKFAICQYLDSRKGHGKSVINQAKRDLIRDLDVILKDVVFIEAREKSVSSIYDKMERNKCSIQEINDIFGIRIILEEKSSCYKALEIIKMKYELVKFKDYIIAPKLNGYRSLHAVIVGTLKKKIEIQIRDKLMHELAEYGSASHELYKREKYG